MSCTQTLSGLAKDCSPSMGGIKKVYIANYDDVAEITEASDKISAITMKTIGETEETEKFKRYAMRRDSASMTSTLNVDQATGLNYVSTELQIVFGKMETAKRVEMSALALGELAVIVQDANDVFWYLGHDEPVVSSAGAGESGTAKSDANRYALTLLDNAKTFPMEILSTAVTTAIVDVL